MLRQAPKLAFRIGAFLTACRERMPAMSPQPFLFPDGRVSLL